MNTNLKINSNVLISYLNEECVVNDFKLIFEKPQTCICRGLNGITENVIICDQEDINFYRNHFFDGQGFDIEIIR